MSRAGGTESTGRTCHKTEREEDRYVQAGYSSKPRLGSHQEAKIRSIRPTISVASRTTAQESRQTKQNKEKEAVIKRKVVDKERDEGGFALDCTAGGGNWKAEADDRTSSRKKGMGKRSMPEPCDFQQQHAHSSSSGSSRGQANSKQSAMEEESEEGVGAGAGAGARNRVNPVNLACVGGLLTDYVPRYLPRWTRA